MSAPPPSTPTPTPPFTQSSGARAALPAALRRPWWGRVLWPLVGWLAALALTVGAVPYLQRANFTFFWIAVLFAAWYAGPGTAVMATVASVLAVDFLFVPPVGRIGVPNPTDLLALAIFAVASLTASSLVTRAAETQRQSAQVARDLAALAEQLEGQAVELEQQRIEATAAASELEDTNARLAAANTKAEAAREEAEVANKAKSDFLARMSHELRTPLNAIGGYVQLLDMELYGPLSAPQRHTLGRVDRAHRHLLGLINDVLNFAKLESGRVAFDVRETRVGDVLADVTPMIGPQLATRQLAFDVRLPEDQGAPPVLVWADREKLGQVLLNLLSNAAKFTPAGGRVLVELAGSADDPASAIVRVADTGVGIPVDKLDAIFDPFVQVHAGGNALTRTHEGTGLGLAISRDLVRGMGGELTAASVPGGGATFTMTLRRVETPDGDRVERRTREHRRQGVDRRSGQDRRDLAEHASA